MRPVPQLRGPDSVYADVWFQLRDAISARRRTAAGLSQRGWRQLRVATRSGLRGGRPEQDMAWMRMWMDLDGEGF